MLGSATGWVAAQMIQFHAILYRSYQKSVRHAMRIFNRVECADLPVASRRFATPPDAASVRHQN
jgi:hypothetical protein